MRTFMTFHARVRLAAGTVLCFFAFCTAQSLSAAPPVIAGFERFGKTDAVGGQLLLSELNCVACHQAPKANFISKQGPVLDNVGTRIRSAYFKKYLADPQK